MNKTLRNIILGTTLATAVIACGAKEPERIDTRLPVPGDNQQLLLHPDYLRGTVSIGYTLLTDMDKDGSWDVAERVHVGYTTGDGTMTTSFKEGYGPARSMPIHGTGTKVEIVGQEFFRPYR